MVVRGKGRINKRDFVFESIYIKKFQFSGIRYFKCAAYSNNFGNSLSILKRIYTTLQMDAAKFQSPNAMINLGLAKNCNFQQCQQTVFSL